MAFSNEPKFQKNYIISTQWDKNLSKVARSFYLTIKFLPQKMRKYVGIAYLLARATDSIADSPDISPKIKKKIINKILKTFTKQNIEKFHPAEYKSSIAKLKNPSERELLNKLNDLQKIWQKIHPDKKNLISKVFTQIVTGQKMDLKFSENNKKKQKHFCLTHKQLDLYTYSVAGCVGEFWTKLGVQIYGNNFFKNHKNLTTKTNQNKLKTDNKKLPHPPPPSPASILEMAVEYGKGLQLINILRDIGSDLKMGRSYLPFNLNPNNNNPEKTFSKNQKIYLEYLQLCKEYLQSGEVYCQNILQKRARIATILPLLIAKKMLPKLETNIKNCKNFEELKNLPKLKITKFQLFSIITFASLFK